MIKRRIKKITVEYEDGSVVTYEHDQMFHSARQNYPGGANPRADSAFTSHEIKWTYPQPLLPLLIGVQETQ